MTLFRLNCRKVSPGDLGRLVSSSCREQDVAGALAFSRVIETRGDLTRHEMFVAESARAPFRSEVQKLGMSFICVMLSNLTYCHPFIARSTLNCERTYIIEKD